MLRSEDAVLVVIDVQERLLPFIHEGERLVDQIVRLVCGFQILRAPIIVTEQYRKGLGPTAPGIIEAVARPVGADVAPAAHDAAPAAAPATRGADPAPAAFPFAPIEKMTFSCAAHPAFLEKLAETRRRQVVLCGIEAHVCVLQTALDLAEAPSAGRGFEVYLAADAVSSRSPRNVEIALRRMEQAGVRMTSSEMAVFEMLHACGTPQFKSWSRIIR